MAISDYTLFAFITLILSPPFGLIALYTSRKTTQFQKLDPERARLWSDFTFSICFVGIVTSIVVIVMVYAYGKFPDSAYYDVKKVING